MDYKFTFFIIAYVVSGVGGLIILYFAWITNRVKHETAVLEKEHAVLEREIAKKNLQATQDQADTKKAVLEEISKITTDISIDISEKLIENPLWLERFMDKTGITYSASVFGKRIGHFFNEKRVIAKAAVDKVEDYLKRYDSTRFCLVIDSGTTTYPVFEEITKRLNQEGASKLWRDRICIVTNNIPGVQYLMKNAKDDPNDDYSEISIKCFIIPGKPLSVYAAITGDESTKWLSNLKDFLNSKDVTEGWKSSQNENPEIKVLGFVTGNYIARRSVANKTYYYPVARGEGHLDIKRTLVDVSKEVFVLAPLMKFSFASVDLLNKVNGFDVERQQSEKAKQYPKRVKYEEVEIPDEKPCFFFTTKRPEGALFSQFSHDLSLELVRLYEHDRKTSYIIMPEFGDQFGTESVEEKRHLEIMREIPHDNLREQYEKGMNIWDPKWCYENEE